MLVMVMKSKKEGNTLDLGIFPRMISTVNKDPFSTVCESFSDDLEGLSSVEFI